MALVQLRLASVSQISKVSKVRREDVYRTVPRLESLGLAEKLLGTPVKIRATPLDDALSILIKQQREAADGRISTLEAKRVEVMQLFNKYNERPIIEEEQVNFSLLSGRELVLGKASSMVKSVEKELDLVCSRAKLMQFVYFFAEQLKKITQKGVKVRIILELEEHEDSTARIIEDHISPKASVELRYVDVPTNHYMITDFREVMISTSTEGNLGDSPCLWTDNGNLVDVLQRNFESFWHDSISWRDVDVTLFPDKIVNFAEQLKPTNHLVFVYDSADAKYQVLFSYLKFGLDNNEAVVYVASDETPTQIRAAMDKFGIDVKKHEKTGALQILYYEEIYIIDGKFSITTTTNLWNRMYYEAIKRKFGGLRVTGEMSCFFKHNIIEDLLDYEKSLHTTLDIPMIAICAYNSEDLTRSRDSINLYNELIRAHRTVLFTGIDNRLGKIEIRKGR